VALPLVNPERPLRPATPTASTPAATEPTAPAQLSAANAAAPAKAASDTKKHETLFEKWPKPTFALLITGRQNGYLEPCGCTGLANQKGGMARRMTLVRELTEQGWPLVALDVGNQVKRFGRQSEMKFQIALEGLKKMNYQAIGFGPEDLRLSTGELVSAVSEQPNRFVCANAAPLDPDLTAKYKVLKAGGKKIGITSVLGDEYKKKIVSDEIVLTPAANALREVLPKLQAENCDLLILMANATLEESRALAKQFPKFQIVITAGGAEEPAFQPELVEGTSTRLVQVGAKGMYAGVLGVFADPQAPFRYQRVPLDDRYQDAKEMMGLLSAYQDQLKAAGLDGLGIKSVPHPSGNQFVGSEKCGDCHTKAMAVWKNTPHAKTTDSIVHPKERSDIPRHFDPECISCHVTGWEPQKFIPFVGGYVGLKESPHLHGNGCENCHGPGSAHVAAESGDVKVSQASLMQLRAGMRLPLNQAEHKCMECHDLDNSPAFHKKGAFEEYWKKVAHPGKD
jgi:hypothetical protein